MKNFFIFSLIIFVMTVTLHRSFGQDYWTQKANFGGSARRSAVGFSIANKGYLGTGWDGGRTKDFWEYDPGNNSWTQKADFGGNSRLDANGFTIGSKGYIGLGHDGADRNDFWEYDPTVNGWTQKANFGGSPRHHATCFSIGSKGYLGTGYTLPSTFHNDFWEYDPSSDTWTQIANFLGGVRWGGIGFSVGGKGYVGLGSDAVNSLDITAYKNDFWEYNPNSDTWSQRSNFGGSPRIHATSLSIGNKGFIGAGYDGAVKNDFWEYDPENNTWVQKATFSGNSRHQAPGFSIGNKGYLGTGTGSVIVTSDLMNDFWEYTPTNECAGHALKFDGVDDCVNVGGAPSLEISSAITMEAWIYPTGVGSGGGGTGGIIINREGEYEISRGTDGTIRFDLHTPSDAWNLGSWISTGYFAPLNEWTHITLTYSASVGFIKVYANGTEVYSLAMSGDIGDAITSQDDFRIGGRQCCNEFFNGVIDEVRIWNTALSESIILEWMSKSVTPDHPGYSNLKGYWKFDEGTGTTTADATSNGSTGTLLNSPIWISASTPLNGATWFADIDGDGYGNVNADTVSCSAPDGYVSNSSDCNDGSSAAHPGAVEVCNSADDNCNGQIDEGNVCDADGDGFTPAQGDCDDNNALVNPNGLPTKQWDARFGGTADDKLYKIVQTADGGYIMGGRSKSGVSGDRSQANWDATLATWDYWVVKTDVSGVKQWDKRYGGTKNDELISLQQTSDGGYIFGGYSFSGISGDRTQANYDATLATADYWIVKTDANGVKQFDLRYGGSGDDQFQDLYQTSDGGYLLAGYSNSGINGDKSQASQGNYDYWIIKINSSGVKQWDARYGGSNADYLYDLQPTSDGGYALGGRSYSGISGDKSQANWDATNSTFDYWIVKTDASGVKQWDKRFGGTSDDILYALKQSSDGGYVLGGYSASGISGDKTMGSQGGTDYWMVKTDGSGSKLWDARFGGNTDEQLFLLERSLDGGYLLGGYSQSPVSGDKTQASQGSRDYWIVKTDGNGAKKWDVRFGGSKIDVATALQTTSDGGYILGGYSFSGATGDKSQANWDASFVTQDYWILKLTNGTGQVPFYADADGDGYGNSSVVTLACSAPSGYVADHADCNDANAAIHPNAADLCNSIDDNCNGVVDENAITATVTPSGTVSVCSGSSVTLTANSGAGISYQWKKGNANIVGATNSTYATTKAAGYKVVETNTFNCTSTSAVTTVSVVSLPTATITPLGNLDICATGSVVLQANAGAGLTYQWVKGANNIAGATNQNYTATQKATYKVIVTNASGCSKTSAGTKVTKSCKEGEVMDEANSSLLAVYPNPTDGKFVIDLSMNEKLNGVAVIEVLNALGQIVYQEKVSIENGMLKKEIAFDHSLAEGMYTVRLKATDKIYTQQIVLQK